MTANRLRVGAACLLLAVVCSCSGPETEDEPWLQLAAGTDLERLNVILITVDTLRADRLSAYGSTRVDTPHMDLLAAEGARFSNAASAVPFTLPAHSTIMTGTYPPYHGVRENVGYFLDERVPTLAETLGQAGYSTAGFVSAFVLDRRWGIARGFDHYFDDFDLRSERQVNLGSVQREGAETIAEALAWLDSGTEPARDPSRPFFLWLHLFDPHDPYEPPEPYRSRYPEHPYDAEVAYADSLIGEFRAALEARGLLDRSLLVLTADHGEGLGDHDESFHGFFVYDSTVHVPLIVRPPFPGVEGRVVDHAVSHVDILPTVLEALGREIPAGVQGSSLLPLMLDPGLQEPPGSERQVYSESYYPLLHYGWAPLRALRTDDHKFIEAPRAELYELGVDARELTDLFRRDRALASDLRGRLDDLQEAIARPEGDEIRQPDIDEAALAQLEALGYVAGRGDLLDENPNTERADPKDKIEIHQAIMWAQSFVSQGDLEEAERRLRDALALDDGMIDAHQMLGHIATKNRDLEQAVGHFQRALALDSDHKNSLFGLASAYRQLGRPEEALVGFRRLMQLMPHDSKPVLAATDIEVELGNLPEAIALLDGVVQRDDSPPIVYNQLGELLVLGGRPAEAEPWFLRAIEKNEQLAQPRFNLGVMADESGDVMGAIRLYGEAIERKPTHYQAHFNLGRLYGRTGDFDRQQSSFEASIDANPEFVIGYYFLGKLLMDRGEDLAQAEEIVRRGLGKDPEGSSGPLGYFVLADILNRQGRVAEAREAVAKGRQLQSEGA
jgi:arylsulfatase A-like enzyme/Tfp pilus assembly protein PilF